MSRTGPAPRRHPLVPLRLAAVLLSIVVSGVSTPRAPAANYTYTIAGSVTNQWTSGTAGSWTSTPVSGSSTGLVFQGQLANGAVNTSHNDVPGTFTLNSLAISATGPINGSSSFTISGNPLRFVVNSGTQPSAITVISGITIPAALISADIVLDDHLSSNVQPSTAVLTLSGTISGLGTFDKTGSGILVIGVGSVVNSFAGDTRIQAGSLSLGSPGALAGSTLDMNTADAGTLDFGTPATTYSLGGLKESRAITASDNTLSIGGNGQSTTYSGGITGTGGNGQRVLFYQQTGEFVVVPEPSTAAMALAGLTLSAAVALRRRLRLRRRIR